MILKVKFYFLQVFNNGNSKYTITIKHFLNLKMVCINTSMFLSNIYLECLYFIKWRMKNVTPEPINYGTNVVIIIIC